MDTINKKHTIVKIVISCGILFGIIYVAIARSALSTPTANDVVSPSDNSRIVFVKNIYGEFEGLYVKDSQGNNVSRIPNACLTRLISPVWSPTGEWIAFGCKTGNRESNLCISNVEGKTFDNKSLGEISECYNYAGLVDKDKAPEEFCMDTIQSIAWAPNGNQLAVACPGSVCFVNLEGDADCWTFTEMIGQEVPVDGTVTIDWFPADDALVLAIRQSIYLINIDGSDAHLVVDGWSPQWSPNGKYLAFFQSGALCIEEFNEGERVCYHLDADDSSLIGDWEAPPRFLDGRIAWSPTGKAVVFSAGQTMSGWPTAIYVLNLEEKIIRQITLSFDGNFSYPDWSPE